MATQAVSQMEVVARPQGVQSTGRTEVKKSPFTGPLDFEGAKKDLKFLSHRCKPQMSARCILSDQANKKHGYRSRGATGQCASVCKDVCSGP